MFVFNQLFSILFYPKTVFIFFSFDVQTQLLVAIQHISVIFAFKRVDFCLMIPHHYQKLGFGCELIVSLSLSSSSYRWLIVGFPKYSSSYRWLKQLLVIVIVSSSVAFFNFETIWSTKSFQKVSSFEKLCFRKKVQRRTHKKRILTRMFDQNCLKVVPVKVARVSRRWSLQKSSQTSLTAFFLCLLS